MASKRPIIRHSVQAGAQRRRDTESSFGSVRATAKAGFQLAALLRYALAGMTMFSFANAAMAKSAPRSLVCTFSKGSMLHFDEEQKVGLPIENTDTSKYIFSEISIDGKIGTYRNVNEGWEGSVIVYNNGEKIDLVEQNIADNGFMVTIFFQKSVDKRVPAVLSRHSFDPKLESDYAPTQQIGLCE